MIQGCSIIKDWHVGLALLACVGCDGAASSITPDPTLITSPVHRGDITIIVNASGKVVPQEQVMVGSEVSGRVMTVDVDFNSEVVAGEILATIDPSSFENRVRQTQGRLSSAKAEVDVQRAGVERAKINLEQAENVLNRQKDLFEKNAASQARLDQAQQALGVARAELKLNSAQLARSQAQLSQADAEHQSAVLDLERTVISSPIDGVVIDRKVSVGQTVQASFSAPELFALAADLSDIHVEAKIIESDVAGFTKGDYAKFTVDAFDQTVFEGEVIQLRLKSQEANNIVSYTAVISADNSSGELMPGMTANLEITTDVNKDVLRVSSQSIRFRPTAEQIQNLASDADTIVASEADPIKTTLVRLKSIDLTPEALDQVSTTLEIAAAPLLEIINDPKRSFMHTPTRINLVELIDNVLSEQLSSEYYSAYRSVVASERLVRDAMIWVKVNDDVMERRMVRIGMSDGAFVEVVSGLVEGEEVVTDIAS